MTCDLAAFGLTEMLRISLQVRRVAGGDTMEVAAQRVCRYLYDEFIDPATGERQCALVRFYKTHPYAALDASLKLFANRMLGDSAPRPDMKCLTLLATVGDEPEWNSRRSSKGHQAIPLASQRLVESAPMIAQLIAQFGLDIATVLNPSPDVLPNLLGKTYGVFHVEDALGSPYIPAQREFVERYGIRSVLGFGGSLRTGDLYALILFARARVRRDGAERFRNVALDVKSMIFNYDAHQIFTPADAPA